jgi:hypothetical protein
MADGYIYCFSNSSMPGILKVGMTERKPEIRLSEANASDTWRPPTPYKIDFAKKVYNPSQKEKALHILLEQYTNRIHPRREFFRVSQEELRKFFDLMDGEMWAETCEEEEDEAEDEEEDEEEDTSSEPAPRARTSGVKGCRDMTKCFTNGQRIRHTIGISNIWVGTYDYSNNKIVHDEIAYDSLTEFATTHVLRDYNPDRTTVRNGWKHCECEVDGKWISTYSLPL